MSDIIGGLQLIDRATLEDWQRVQIDRVAGAAAGLSRLLGQMLDSLDALPVGEGRVERFELAPFLQDIVARWDGRAQASGARFSVRLDDDLPAWIATDRIALERIIGNLISNALKYAPNGRVCLSVSRRSDGALLLAVSDDGPGFSQEALASLFAFRARPRNADRPGRGLGLHIASRLARAIGAELRARNCADGGAKVTLRLPPSGMADAAAQAGIDADRGPSEIPDLRGMRVLLAEDNPTNQLVATQMLAAMGCETRAVSDGAEALRALEEERFDAVLLDIEMPRMSGLELMAEIRRRGGDLGRLPLVVLTAYVMREHRARIMAAGADAIVPKPITSIADLGLPLARCVRTAADGARRENAAGAGGADGLDGAVAASDHLAGSAGSAQADAVSGAPDLHEIDRGRLAALMAAVGTDSRAELKRRLKEDLTGVRKGLSAAIEANDTASYRAHSHVLISVAGMCGAGGLKDAATRLNGAAHAGEASACAQHARSCIDGIASLIGALETADHA